MGKIPVYEAPTVEPARLPTPYRSLDRPGSALVLQQTAQSLAQAGQVLNDIAAREKQRADRAVINKSVKDYSTFQTVKMTEALSQEGENAFGVVQSTIPELDKFQMDLVANLTPDQRLDVEERTSSMAREAALQLHRHVAQERDKVYQKAFEDRLEAGMQTVVGFAPDFRQMGSHMAMVENDIALYGWSEGWPSEQTEQTTTAWRTATLKTSIDALITQDRPTAARELYEDVKEHIVPTDRAIIEGWLKPKETEQEAQDIVDKIVSEVGERPGEKDWTYGVEEINGIKDVQLRSAAMTMWKDRFQQVTKGWTMKQDEIFDRSWKIVDETGSTDKVLRADWDAMTPDQRVSLQELQRRKVADASKVKTRWEVIAEKWDTLSAQEKAAFTPQKMYAEIWPYVDETDWQTIRNEWQAARKTDGSYQSFTQSFDSYTAENYGTVKKKQRSEVAQLKREAWRQVSMLEQEKKRSLTTEELDDTVGKLFTKVALSDAMRGFWDTDTYLGLKDEKFTEEQLPQLYVPYEEIPEDYQRSLANYLGDKNLPNDTASVENAYYQYLAGELPDYVGWQEKKASDEQVRVEQQAKGLISTTFSGAELEIPGPWVKRATDALEALGRPVKPETIREAYLELRVKDLVDKLGKDVIPPSERRRAEIQGRLYERPVEYSLPVMKYWALRQLGLPDDEARERVGLPPRNKGLAEQLLESEGE